MPEDLLGTVVDSRYEILSSLGEGGMGAVFLARQLDNDRTVAVKVLHAFAEDEDSKRRFYREAKLWSFLRHEGIGRFYQYGEWGKVPYIVMEFLPGTTLEQYLREHETIAWKEVLEICEPICGALQYLHDQNVIHRDLKPANIILADNNPGKPKLIDFGLSKSSQADLAPSQSLTATGMLVGSYPYMSPEQCAGKRATDKSDMYAFGCIMFELISGRQVFEADSPIGVIYKHANEAPPELRKLVPSIPAKLATVVDALLEKAPSRRPSARKLKQQLESISLNPLEEIASVQPEKRLKEAILAALGLFSVAAITAALNNPLKLPASTGKPLMTSKEMDSGQSLIQQRTNAINSIEDPEVRASMNSLRPEVLYNALRKRHNNQMDEYKYQEAFDLCSACSNALAGVPSSRRQRIEGYLAIPTAESAMALGRAAEAEKAIRKYWTEAPTCTGYFNSVAQVRVHTILAWSLTAQSKLDEAESAVRSAYKYVPVDAPSEMRFKLNWLLADIYRRKGDLKAAKATLPAFLATDPGRELRQFNTITGAPNLEHRLQESLSDGYAIAGDRKRQLQHLWLAMETARALRLRAESDRLKSAAAHILTGRKFAAGFTDPYTIYEEIPQSHAEKAGSIKQLDDAIVRLNELCAPSKLIVALYLRKCQLLKRLGDFAAAEEAAIKALALSDEGPQSPLTLEAKALVAERLTAQGDLKKARKYILQVESHPDFCSNNSATNVVMQYYMTLGDKNALEKLLSWSKTNDANKLTIGAELAVKYTKEGSYADALKAVSKIRKITGWNSDNATMAKLFFVYASRSDWKNLFQLRAVAGTDMTRHELTAMLAHELFIKDQVNECNKLLAELNRTPQIMETLESANKLADLYNRKLMFNEWHVLFNKIHKQANFDRHTCAALGAQLAHQLDLQGRRSEADQVIETVGTIPEAAHNQSVQCLLGAIYEHRRNLDALRRVFSSTDQISPDRSWARAVVALQLSRLLVMQHHNDEAIDVLTKVASDIDGIALETTKKHLAPLRAEMATILKSLKALPK